jgi:D-aminoacyl-tRNA deacylase
MKYLIVASKQDKAGMNIVLHLDQLGKFDIYLIEDSILHTNNLNILKINDYDFIIFASKHQSNKQEKALTVHPPGNWKDNTYGGQPGKLCPTSACFIKQIFQELKKQRDDSNLKEYDVTLEATHHGPLIDKPCIFIEIGSTESEWKDPKAGFVVAKTIRNTIESFSQNQYNEYVIGIGGPHYCPNFNKIQFNSNLAISHILPQYSLPISEDNIKEAIENTTEEVDFFLLDWKGLGNSESRKQVTDILDKMKLYYRKTSEFSK